jgi:hypothetical protein
VKTSNNTIRAQPINEVKSLALDKGITEEEWNVRIISIKII